MLGRRVDMIVSEYFSGTASKGTKEQNHLRSAVYVSRRGSSILKYISTLPAQSLVIKPTTPGNRDATLIYFQIHSGV